LSLNNDKNNFPSSIKDNISFSATFWSFFFLQLLFSSFSDKIILILFFSFLLCSWVSIVSLNVLMLDSNFLALSWSLSFWLCAFIFEFMLFLFFFSNWFSAFFFLIGGAKLMIWLFLLIFIFGSILDSFLGIFEFIIKLLLILLKSDVSVSSCSLSSISIS
jgi:hypothetical protein